MFRLMRATEGAGQGGGAMKRIDATVNGTEYTFRTNNDGSCLFTGVGENRQISCESGFDSLRKIKRTIRVYLAGDNQTVPRISYNVHPADWTK
jgi:hypothetical protein